jgi:hypothetical protein
MGFGSTKDKDAQHQQQSQHANLAQAQARHPDAGVSPQVSDLHCVSSCFAPWPAAPKCNNDSGGSASYASELEASLKFPPPLANA